MFLFVDLDLHRKICITNPTNGKRKKNIDLTPFSVNMHSESIVCSCSQYSRIKQLNIPTANILDCCPTFEMEQMNYDKAIMCHAPANKSLLLRSLFARNMFTHLILSTPYPNPSFDENFELTTNPQHAKQLVEKIIQIGIPDDELIDALMPYLSEKLIDIGYMWYDEFNDKAGTAILAAECFLNDHMAGLPIPTSNERSAEDLVKLCKIYKAHYKVWSRVNTKQTCDLIKDQETKRILSAFL